MREKASKIFTLFFCAQLTLSLCSCTPGAEKKEATSAPVSEVSIKDLTRDQVEDMIRPQLEKAGFKYDLEKHSFARNGKDYRDEITVQANNKADFYFHFGRIFPAVAKMVAPFESKKYLNTPDLTIWDSSMNAGPNSSEHYKVEGTWTYTKETESQVSKEVTDFISEFLLPWLENYPNLKSARDKLVRRPMIKAETTMQILAIDVLLKDKAAFKQELSRSLPVLENSTNHDSVDRVQRFTESIYSQYPEFKSN